MRAFCDVLVTSELVFSHFLPGKRDECPIITNMTEPEGRKLSHDELFRRRSIASDGSVARDALDAEVKRREFMAGQAAGRTARSVAVLTLCLVAVGLLQAWATRSAGVRQIDNGVRYSIAAVDGRLCVLDTNTGVVFRQESDGWHEYQPQSGRVIIRPSFQATDKDPLGIR